MGVHDQHLPRRHLNKAPETKGAPAKLVSEVVKAQGQQTKADAKNARAKKRR